MLTVGQVAENCFILRRDGADRGLIVDPGEEAERILHVVDELGLGIDAILLTHTHFDHIGAVAPVARATGRPGVLPGDRGARAAPTSWPSSPGPASGRTRATRPTRRSPAARRSSWPGCEIEVLFTPGHSPGHVTYAIRDEGALFSGDVLFQGSVGRVDLPGRRLADAAGEHPQPGRRLPRGDDRLSRPHGDHDPRRRARDQPVPGRARSLGCCTDDGALPGPPGDLRHPARRARRAPARVHDAAAELFGRAGYGRIETPAFEDTELFARGVGQATDIVRKEMFTFTDQGDRSLTLRPEGTAPICRAYIEHGMHQPAAAGEALARRAPFFRHERPQAGRFRQFHQLGAEAIGSDSPLVDAELIVLLDDLLRGLGVPGLELRLSSLGSPATARRLPRRAAGLPARTRGRPGAGRARADRREPAARASTPRTRARAAAMADAPRMLDRLDERRRRALRRGPARCSTGAGVAYELDGTLVRGLDYYTRTVFAFESESPRRAGRELGGGGRYDGLVEALGGPADARLSAGRRASSASCSLWPSPSPSRRPTSSWPRPRSRREPRVRARARAARRGPAGRARPRRALAQGPDEAGRPDRRAPRRDPRRAGRPPRCATWRAASRQPLDLGRAAEAGESVSAPEFPALRANEYRDTWCGQVLGRPRRLRRAGRRLGPPPPRPRRPGLHRPARPHRASSSSSSTPTSRARRSSSPTGCAPRTCLTRVRAGRAPRPRDGQPGAADGRVRGPGARRDAARRRGDAAVRDRGLLGRGGRGGAPAPPLPRPAPRADGAGDRPPPRGHRGDPRVPRRRGLPRHRDPDAVALDPRGGARLPRPVAARAGLVLRAAAVAAAVQAAADGRPGSSATSRSRAAFATRISAPTASPTSPSSTSRCRSSASRTCSTSTSGCWPPSSSGWAGPALGAAAAPDHLRRGDRPLTAPTARTCASGSSWPTSPTCLPRPSSRSSAA